MVVGTSAVPGTNVQLGTLCQQLIGQSGARQLNAIYQGTGNYWNPNDGGHTSTATSQRISNLRSSTFVAVSGQAQGTQVAVSQSTNGYVYVKPTTQLYGAGGNTRIATQVLPGSALSIQTALNQKVYLGVASGSALYGGGGGGGSVNQGQGDGAREVQQYTDAQGGATGVVPTTAIQGYIYNSGTIYGGCGGGGWGWGG